MHVNICVVWFHGISIFFNECERTVKKDNTFSFAGIRYETPVDLREKRITVRYERNKDTRVVVYYKHQRMGAALALNLIANGQLRRGEQVDVNPVQPQEDF